MGPGFAVPLANQLVAGPGAGAHVVIGNQTIIPAELQAFYTADYASTLGGGQIFYFGGAAPQAYYYLVFTTNTAHGQLQIAEGFVVWAAGTPSVVPWRHMYRPDNTPGLGGTVVQIDESSLGSSMIWGDGGSPDYTFDIQTAAQSGNPAAFLKYGNFPLPLALLQSEQQNQTANVTLSSAFQNLTNASLTVQSGSAENVIGGAKPFMVWASFDIAVSVAAVGDVQCQCTFDGVAMAGGLARAYLNTVGRMTVSYEWRGLLTDRTTHTLQLQARKTVAGGTAVAGQDHTTLQYLIMDDTQPA